jgi:hypothetical protein
MTDDSSDNDGFSARLPNPKGTKSKSGATKSKPGATKTKFSATKTKPAQRKPNQLSFF